MKKLTLYKGKAMACFLLLFLVLINGCKKELLLPKNIEDPSTDKIRTISYAQFINAVNLNSTGSLKEALSGQKAKLMNTQALDGNLNLEMDSVKKLTLGDTISYVVAIKPQTPRATTFQNLTIQVIKTKTTAFLSTYYPEKEWIDNWRQNRKTTFKGTITFNKIYLDDAESNSSTLKTSSLEKKEGGLKDKMFASINGKTGLGNVISLMPGECEIYDVVTVVQQQCKFGHWNRGECDYLTIHPNWEPTSDDWPPSTTINISTVVNCAMPNFPSDGGGGGGAGSTTPNPPGTYNPCDGNPQPVGPGGISFENGTRLMVGAPTNCDELPGLPVTTTTLTPQQYLVNNLDLSVAEYNFVNNPQNGVAVAELSKYLINNGKSVENSAFVKWSIGYLIENYNLNFDNFKNDFLGLNVFAGIHSIPSSILDEPEIQNGIQLEILPDVLATPSGPLLAKTAARNNTEDLEHGTNADFKGIRPDARTATTEGLFLSMKALLIFCTTNDHQMQSAAMDFLDRFRNSTGGVYSHPILTNKVKASSEFKNFLKRFGNTLNVELRKTGGNINSINPLTLGFRPSFNNTWSLFNGLTILLNDTEQTEINLESYSITNGHWTANVLVTVSDHFGLDRHDALKYQYTDPGFAAWWVLQHDRNYKPFETKITIRTKIEGDL